MHFRNTLVFLHVALGNLGCASGTFRPSRKERDGLVFGLETLPWFHFQLLCGIEDKFYLFSNNSGLTPNITEALYGPQSPLLGICHPQNNTGIYSRENICICNLLERGAGSQSLGEVAQRLVGVTEPRLPVFP